MSFLSFVIDGRPSFGLAVDGGIVDIGARTGATLAASLARIGIDELADAYADTDADLPLDAVRFLPPVPEPEKIVCVGVNYAERNAEYRDGSEAPRYPSLFMRAPDSFTGHGEPILRPPESRELDYEGEIGLVIGRVTHRVAPEDALEAIAGLTIVNEGTVRDWVRHGKFNVTQGKNFRHSGAVGPYLVPRSRCPAFDALELTTRVNGKLRQHETTDRLMFPFACLVSYLSTFFVLKPGDLVSTGTPTGSGARLDPPRFLEPGDRVTVSVGGIGTLENPVADDPEGAVGAKDSR